jgi:hypothetical protein
MIQNCLLCILTYMALLRSFNDDGVSAAVVINHGLR